ncbi:MAG TPA: asparagine synthase (glutamine-hydrolyzing) [Thermoanaerobaculia bacterium]|jgi:asparagine synthase (glutamine-hydrolysing)
MCGIAGLWSFGGGDSAELRARAASMAGRLRHRGPDDEGVFVDGGVALGFRRLAIIDLTSAGAQPMTIGRYTIVFNGEVYNAERLRRELPAREWRGHSDTEVMLACIEEWGLVRAIESFIGMFAFALWDAKERRLTLVRDRMGVKPLYYALDAHGLQFASELHALDVERRLDRGAVALYGRYGYVPAPWSIFEGVRKLPPGCLLEVHADGRAEVRTWWSAAQVAERAAANRFQGTEREAVDRLEELLADAVRLRMISDVPLGVFFSGGIDSGVVAALMQREASAPVRTFTIGFEDRRYDEAPLAAEAAAHLGTEHTAAYISARETLELIPQLGRLTDEPLGDSSLVPMYLVSRMARQSVTVALSGDGGDELFAGYHRHFLGARVQRRVASVPRLMRPALGRLLRKRERFRALGNALMTDDPLKLFHAQVSLGHALMKGAVPPVALTSREAWPRLDDATELILWLDAVSYLPDDILFKVDRASMAVSLEAREPLLDHRVVEFAWSLPLSLKIRNDRGKYVLKEVLRRYLPDAMVDREKQGFGLPTAEWLRGPLREWAESLIARVEHFEGVDAMWRAHLAGEDQPLLWRVLMFQQWLG